MNNDGIGLLQQPRITERLAAVKDAKDDADQMAAIMALFVEIRKASKSIVDELGAGVAISNLDEVTTALHNETTRNAKLLMGALKEFQLSNEKQAKVLAAVNKDSQSRLEEEFQTIRIRRPLDKVTVTNPEDFPKTEEVRVSNHPDLAPFFKSLEEKIAETFNISIPAPQVSVDAPVIHIPEQVVNIPDFDLDPIVSELSVGLKKLRDNNKSNPVFVRLTDIQQLLDKLEELRSGQMTALSGFPNQLYIRDQSGGIINPSTEQQSTLKAFANIAGGTTDGAIITAVAGKVIRVVAVASVAAATATNLTFNSKPAGSGTAISCLFANGANGGEVLSYNPKGWFDTNSGEGLTATTGGGSTTGILINYILI